MNKRFTKSERRTLRLVRSMTVLVFCLCMAIGTISGLMLWMRPKTSAAEKRDLTAFPSFTMASFLDGTWFSGISKWYSDSYPGRDQFLEMNNKVSRLYGIEQSEMIVGTQHVGDEIGAVESTSEKQFEEQTEVPDLNLLDEEIQANVMEGLLVKDGAAYGGFYFVQEACDQYTGALNRAAKELEGITTVYSVIAPCNSSIMLDEETYKKLSGSDQRQAINYFYSRYNDLVKPVATFDILKEHCDEPLYFKTDHHWTALGTYYAYENFCKVKGIEPVNKDELEKITYEPFYGSYTSMLPGVEFSPDVFEAWVPKGGNTMKIFTADYGNPNSDQYYEHAIVETSEGIDQYNHYMRFIAGDQPFIECENTEISDGSSALVISESYGCTFVPWIVNNYDKVYAMDQRYSDGNFVTFCKENNITDLIVVNNIQLANSTSLAATIDAKMH